MPSARFAALAAKAAAAADGLTAEVWTLVPMAQSAERDAGAVPDPSRLGLAFLGTFTDSAAKPDANSYDRRQQRRPGTVSGKVELIVSPAALAVARALAEAQGGAFALAQGDKLLRAADSVTWSVNSVFPMPAGTLRLGLDVIG